MAKRWARRGFYGTMTLGKTEDVLAVRPYQVGYNTRLEALRSRIYDRVIALAEAGKGAEAVALEDRLRQGRDVCGR